MALVTFEAARTAQGVVQAAIEAGTLSEAADAQATVDAVLVQAELIRQGWADDPAHQAMPRAWPDAMRQPGRLRVPVASGTPGATTPAADLLVVSTFTELHDAMVARIEAYAPGAPGATRRSALVRAVCWAWGTPRSPLRTASASPVVVEGSAAARQRAEDLPAADAPEQSPGSLAWRDFDVSAFHSSGAASMLSPYRTLRARPC